jgi:prepilin-type N-terminal cleavage/methylation domain-containing protein
MKNKCKFLAILFPKNDDKSSSIEFIKNKLSTCRSCYPRDSGLTLVELLVSLALVSTAIFGAITLLNNGVFGLRKSESNYTTQNLIDRNLSEIESASDRYVCSTTTCTVSNGIPAKSDYVNSNDSAVWNAFAARCVEQNFSAGQDLMSPLVNYIDLNISVPTGLFREIQINGSGSTAVVGVSRIKHFTVQYRVSSASGAVLRNSTIVPTIVSYCP